MKKKTYKHMINRILRLEKAIRIAEAGKEKAEKEARYYKERLASIGRNMRTEDVNSEVVRTIKWEIHPQAWGNYLCIDGIKLFDMRGEDLLVYMKREAIRSISEGLIDKELVQFIIRNPDISDPLNRYGTFAAKLYVVPWEQVPHKRTIELITLEKEMQHEREAADAQDTGEMPGIPERADEDGQQERPGV